MALSNDFIDRELYKAFVEARKGKLDTTDEYKFEMRFAENLVQLREDIIHRRYKPSRSTAFINHNPVDREIFAAPFRDRVVHHFICNFIMDWWDRRLNQGSYSCRKGRGTDAGIRDMYKRMRKVSENFHKPTVVIKIDLSSYFCSIPRRKLYERVLWGLKRQFLYSGHTRHEEELYICLKYVCKEIIFDNPTIGVRIKGSVRDWEKYPRRKSLFYQRPGIGIVIGNLTSQMFSNIYLDQLDRFATMTLGMKNYGRYVDDAYFVLLEEQKDWFMETQMPKLQDYISGMGLTMNPKKTFCQNIDKGIPFLGAVLYPYRILPGVRIKRNFWRTLELVQAGAKDLECLVSYMGRLQHFDSQSMIENAFSAYGLDYKRSSLGPSSLYYTDPKLYEQKKIW